MIALSPDLLHSNKWLLSDTISACFVQSDFYKNPGFKEFRTALFGEKIVILSAFPIPIIL